MTTETVRRQKRLLAERAGPLEAATFALLQRNFDDARQQTDAILAAHPDDPKAFLLMAVLHDFWCLNRPDEALQWYGRLAAMKDDRAAVYAGLYATFRIHYTRREWDQALAAGELLLEEVPCLGESMTSEVERFMEYAKRHRDKDAAKQPASAASNR